MKDEVSAMIRRRALNWRLLMKRALLLLFLLFGGTANTFPQTFIWAKQAGGSQVDYGYAVSVDAGGNSYATGYFQGTIAFPGLRNRER